VRDARILFEQRQLLGRHFYGDRVKQHMLSFRRTAASSFEDCARTTSVPPPETARARLTATPVFDSTSSTASAGR